MSRAEAGRRNKSLYVDEEDDWHETTSRLDGLPTCLLALLPCGQESPSGTPTPTEEHVIGADS